MTIWPEHSPVRHVVGSIQKSTEVWRCDRERRLMRSRTVPGQRPTVHPRPTGVQPFAARKVFGVPTVSLHHCAIPWKVFEVPTHNSNPRRPHTWSHSGRCLPGNLLLESKFSLSLRALKNQESKNAIRASPSSLSSVHLVPSVREQNPESGGFAAIILDFLVVVTNHNDID